MFLGSDGSDDESQATIIDQLVTREIQSSHPPQYRKGEKRKRKKKKGKKRKESIPYYHTDRHSLPVMLRFSPHSQEMVGGQRG